MSDEYQRAVALMNEGDHAQARKLLEDALAQRSGDLQLRLALGVCLILLSEPRGAEDQLRLIVADEPRNPSAWYHLGISLQSQARRDEAARAYRRALQIEDHADAWERLAQCEPADDSVALETLHPRRRHFCVPAVVATLFTIGVICTGQAGSLVSPLDTLLPLALIAFCAFAWAAVELQARRNEYVIFERRLELTVGVLSRRAVSIGLFQVTGVRVVRGPLSALTRTASVEVDYGGDLRAELEGVGDPAEAGRVATLLTRLAAIERHDLDGIPTDR